MQKKEIKPKLLTIFFQVLVIDVAIEYLDKKDKNEWKSTPKAITDYLDSSLFFIEKFKKIEIINKNNNFETVVKMDEKKNAEFIGILNKNIDAKKLCDKLNFAYWLAQNKKTQNIIFKYLLKEIKTHKTKIENIKPPEKLLEQKESIFLKPNNVEQLSNSTFFI